MNGDAVQEVNKMKQELLDDLERIAHELPPNTLDELIDSLGGTDHVAEVGDHLQDAKISCMLPEFTYFTHVNCLAK